MLKNQNISQKPCPRCGVNTIYTGERCKGINPKIDGVEVCEDCVVKEIRRKYVTKEKTE